MDTNLTDKVKTFCVSIDGSKYSDYGFDLTFNELYKKGDKLVISHITNPDKTELPYECQAKTIHSKYTTICSGKFQSSDYEIVIMDKNKDSVHALDTLNSISTSRNVSAMILGFQGHKENKQKNELTKGIIYMIKTITLPTFIIKETCTRKSKESGGFTWVVLIEDQDSNSYESFQVAITFMHPNKDKVVGICVVKQQGKNQQDLQNNFNDLCKKANMKNYDFKLIDKTSDTISKQLVDLVNFGEEMADFVVVGHNVKKYNQIDSSPTIELIKMAQSNIFYYSSNKK